ncbi:hypothetical protein ACFLXL_01480 [Chloroflexota bacterium]
MKKLLLLGVVIAVLCAMVAVPVFAAKPNPAGENPNNLYLYEKDSTDWSIVSGGAWGKYNYKLSGSGAETAVSGPFNGHGLVVGEEYSLIYYPEVADNPWTLPPVVQVIGSGVANDDGDVHIAGSAIIGEPDVQPTVGDYIDQTGDKIWLVLSSDLSTVDETTTMIGWNPGSYLFEQKLINTP